MMLPSGNDAAVTLANYFGDKLLCSQKLKRPQSCTKLHSC